MARKSCETLNSSGWRRRSRRALILRFAQAAADRLHRLADPGGATDF